MPTLAASVCPYICVVLLVKVTMGGDCVHQGEDSEAGVFVVMEGSLGVFLQEDEQRTAPPLMTNTLREGESVGDVDVLDGAPRFRLSPHPRTCPRRCASGTRAATCATPATLLCSPPCRLALSRSSPSCWHDRRPTCPCASS